MMLSAAVKLKWVVMEGKSAAVRVLKSYDRGNVETISETLGRPTNLEIRPKMKSVILIKISLNEYEMYFVVIVSLGKS